MTQTLILTRHAKSDWTDGLADHERPLSARGRTEAQALGRHLAAQGWMPDLTLSSSARRAQETAALAHEALPEHPQQDLFDLYQAGPLAMLLALRRAGPSRVVMMVGHNPGIANFASKLLARAPGDMRFDQYPSGTTTVIGFPNENWPALEFGTGQLLEFIVPRDLT
ncbi:hypothetical protein BV394_10915 [Brevirhabdus pacifica]|uniref:Uncharacterized protein n=1 Tax=Brevirhabdus pacifica TaxID=1267768 RepID=A0A1U7DJV0_9RHOB|nr:histidine phosphatase family protein [Brevirhabdus pacifica]APX90173.1 hypothetical protein BV394_10915 [Brevirhabdus pacifica]OWU78766.1 hypothetical protein ATO5_08545 [Loktanella sp. 22II-4b]PJJ80599.1 phosphohistidine phosphatase [Brevirhabdus pacifica]